MAEGRKKKESAHLCDEGGDGPQAVGEDHRADDCDEDGEEPLQVRDGQDVPVAHRAAKVLLLIRRRITWALLEDLMVIIAQYSETT